MANIINKLTGNKAGIKYVERRNWDVKKRLCSSIEKAKRILGYEPKTSFEEGEKAKRILGYEPKTSFEEGLEKVHKWFEENWENIKKSAKF